MRTRFPLYLLLLVAALGCLHALQLSSTLPERVASHFDANGNANGWMSRGAFVGVYLGTIALITLVFLVLPRAIAATPVRYINLPNKDYWLAPERRQQTLDAIAAYLGPMGAVTLSLLITIMRMVARANLGIRQTLGEAVPMLVFLHMAGTLGLVIAMVRRFSRRPPEP